jgi:hypothetical protein
MMPYYYYGCPLGWQLCLAIFAYEEAEITEELADMVYTHVFRRTRWNWGCNMCESASEPIKKATGSPSSLSPIVVSLKVDPKGQRGRK